MGISTIPICLEVDPESDSLPNASWFVKAGDPQALRRPAGPPQALSRLLDLAEFRVTGVAYDDRLERLIVLCQHVWTSQCARTARSSRRMCISTIGGWSMIWPGSGTPAIWSSPRGASPASTAGGPSQRA